MTDVPPLEDMSEVVKSIKTKTSTEKPYISETQTKDTSISETQTKDTSISETQTKDTSVSNNKFGGMKKGFLFSKPKPTSQPSQFDIKPNASPENPFVFKEVQSAVSQNSEHWITEDLLGNINNNKTLIEKLSHPKYVEAVELMKKDPKAAVKYYKNDQDVQNFFKEFHQILGNHFTKLGNTSENQLTTNVIKSKDEIEMERILSKPEIREILGKPNIKNLFEMLKNAPEKAQFTFANGDPRMRADVQKLVSAGLLDFQSQ